MLPTSTGYGRNNSTPLLLADSLAAFFDDFERRQELRTRALFSQLLAEQADQAVQKEKDEELLSKRQTAEELGGVRTKTVDAWTAKGLLTRYRVGGRIFYKRGEVRAALQEQTQPDGRRKYARGATNKNSR